MGFDIILDFETYSSSLIFIKILDVKNNFSVSKLVDRTG